MSLPKPKPEEQNRGGVCSSLAPSAPLPPVGTPALLIFHLVGESEGFSVTLILSSSSPYILSCLQDIMSAAFKNVGFFEISRIVLVFEGFLKIFADKF